MNDDWPIRLYKKSVLKQRKFKEVSESLGPTEGLHCLDIGGDNGVISYLLRQRGGSWKSADLDEQSVRAIQALVGSEVYCLNGSGTPFATDEFDRVAIVDYLEHIPGDAELMAELQRVLKPGGLVVINVPYLKNSLLRRLRIALGQTDEKHGHLRPGYTVELLDKVMGQAFTRQSARTYSKFFSELIDTLIVFGVSRLQKGKQEQSKKGLFVTGQDLKANQKMFRAYSLIYPIVWFFAKLDSLLVFSSGYMLIVTARVNKDPQRLSSF